MFLLSMSKSLESSSKLTLPPVAPVAPAAAPDVIVDPLTTCAGIVVTKVVPLAAVSVVVMAIVALPPIVVFGVVCVALNAACCSELITDSAFEILDA